jgi:hypothetical protein
MSARRASRFAARAADSFLRTPRRRCAPPLRRATSRLKASSQIDADVPRSLIGLSFFDPRVSGRRRQSQHLRRLSRD